MAGTQFKFRGGGRRLSQVADVLLVARKPGLLALATRCEHAWATSHVPLTQSRFQLEDLTLQHTLHLLLANSVLYRYMVQGKRLTVTTNFQQVSFGFRYDVAMHCEASENGVRGGGKKFETEVKEQKAPLLVFGQASGAETLQLSSPELGLQDDDMKTFLHLRNISSYYCFHPNEGRMLAFHVRADNAAEADQLAKSSFSALERNLSPENMRSVVPGTDVSSEPYSYWCSCTRDRVFKHLKTMPPHTIQELMETGCRMACSFCNEEHTWTREELDPLLGDPHKRFLGL